MLRTTALVLLAVGIAVPAAAQQAISDPDTIGHCLCLHRDVDARSAAVDSTRQALDQAQANATSLSQEVVRQRAQVQVDKDTDIAAFTDLLRRSEAATAQVNAMQVPAYNNAVAAYNQSVAAYSDACAGRSFDAAALARVQAGLSCPRP